jgi:hypothetical protein
MDKLKTTFEETFKLPFSILSIPEKDLVPADSREESMLFRSRSGPKRDFLLGDIGYLINDCPPGFLLVGFWGYGANSYAFYYSRTDEWSKIYFRLGYGGVYADTQAEAKAINKFFMNYFPFERRIKSCGYNLLALDSMGMAQYQITEAGKLKFEHRESMLSNPDFSKIFKLIDDDFKNYPKTNEKVS